MAFPVVLDHLSQGFSSSATSHAVDMPSFVGVDNLLLLFTSVDSGKSVNTPSGWTQIYEGDNATANCFAKKADGTEGGTTLAILSPTTCTVSTQLYNIIDWDGTIATGINVSTQESRSSTSIPPDALTAAWGAGDTLWLAVVHAYDDDATITGYPSGYTDGLYVVSGGGSNNGNTMGSARKESSAATEDPSSFYISATQSLRAWTLAIKSGTAGTEFAANMTPPVAIGPCLMF